MRASATPVRRTACAASLAVSFALGDAPKCAFEMQNTSSIQVDPRGDREEDEAEDDERQPEHGAVGGVDRGHLCVPRRTHEEHVVQEDLACVLERLPPVHEIYVNSETFTLKTQTTKQLTFHEISIACVLVYCT